MKRILYVSMLMLATGLLVYILPDGETRSMGQTAGAETKTARITNQLNTPQPGISAAPAGMLKPNMREQVMQHIAAMPLQQETDKVREYLYELEMRAIRQGRVSALEVEPGIEAIKRLAPVIGTDKVAAMSFEFEQRMEQLAMQLTTAGQQQRVDSAQLDNLLAEIDNTGGKQREEHITAYLKVIDQLDDKQQADAIMALDSLIKVGLTDKEKENEE